MSIYRLKTAGTIYAFLCYLVCFLWMEKGKPNYDIGRAPRSSAEECLTGAESRNFAKAPLL